MIERLNTPESSIITTQIETWSCENGHNWTIDQDSAYPKVSPYDEGYTEKCLAKWGYPSAFTVEGVGTMSIQPGQCPLCFVQGVFPVPMLALGTDKQNNYSEMSVIDPTKIADISKIVVTGTDPDTGVEITDERSLTSQEQDTLVAQAQEGIDKLQNMEFVDNAG